jgi:hypothetical protein
VAEDGRGDRVVVMSMERMERERRVDFACDWILVVVEVASCLFPLKECN